MFFSEVFDAIVDDYRAGMLGTIAERSIHDSNPQLCQETLIECILSSAWEYGKARTAAQEFTRNYGVTVWSGIPEPEEIERFLRHQTVRHRFPRSRAAQLHISLAKLNGVVESFRDFVGGFGDEFELRSHIASEYPGLGLKQTSMFLRDTGAAKNLAVVDVHILWFLKNAVGHQAYGSGKQLYLEIERSIRGLCQERMLSMSVFDRLVWITVREFKRLRRSGRCGMQYVLPLGD